MTSVPGAHKAFAEWEEHLERTKDLMRPSPRDGTFTWRGVELTYLDHPYNTTLLNERCVEVPIALEWLGEIWDMPGDGLEVGNVLSHYGWPPDDRRRVVDLHEEAEGVDNVDVRDLLHGEDRTYDWILSISTLEHVGQHPDGSPNRNPEQGVDVVEDLLDLLNDGGQMLVTAPFGQNPHLDTMVLLGRLDACDLRTMVRWGDGTWHEEPGARWLPSREMGWPQAVWVAEWVKP